MTQTIPIVYEGGVLRPKPRRKLPWPEHTRLTMVIRPTDPVSRTRGRFRVSKRQAQILIYDDSLLE